MQFDTNLRLAGLVAAELFRRLRWAVAVSPLFRWRFQPWREAKLAIAPQDLRTADPTVANEIYAGRFAFAGKLVSAGGHSPFELTPPSREWAKALYGFGWLRHLRAAASPLARANARALVEEWIDQQGNWHSLAWRPEITARRVLAWLAQSPLVLEQADFSFYRKFVGSLTKQIRYLIVARRLMRTDVARLQVAIALAQASLCLESMPLQRRARRWLDAELRRQLFADGGHISRNPGVILQILLDLLPLRHSYIAQSQMPPQSLLDVIDRIIPLIRFFRHGDGAFALFDGMGPTPVDVVATLLSYDETRGEPPNYAPYSGYQRLQAAGSLILTDAGAPPPTSVSQEAHAGTLAFEFSDDLQRIVVNCGMPWVARATWQPLARLTAAHSTLEIGGQSSSVFSRAPIVGLMGSIIADGPHKVSCERRESKRQGEILMSHDGYVARFGVVHRRKLTLLTDGNEFHGEDELVPIRGVRPVDAPFALRFHLHPNVKASRLREGEAVLLLLPDGCAWEFSAPGYKAAVEESIYLGAADGARRSEQIVIYGRVRATPQIHWNFIRYTGEAAHKYAEANEEPVLPL